MQGVSSTTEVVGGGDGVSCVLVGVAVVGEYINGSGVVGADEDCCGCCSCARGCVPGFLDSVECGIYDGNFFTKMAVARHKLSDVLW